MKGFMYRLAVAIREYGERYKLPCLISLGLAIREWAMEPPINLFCKGGRD